MESSQMDPISFYLSLSLCSTHALTHTRTHTRTHTHTLVSQLLRLLHRGKKAVINGLRASYIGKVSVI